MNPLFKIIEQIKDFDNEIAPNAVHVFKAKTALDEEIHALTAFGDITANDSLTLKNMLDGIFINKLKKFDSELSKKIAYVPDHSIQQSFVQNLSKTCEKHIVNHREFPPIYNMGEKDEYPQSEKYAFPRHLDNHKLISTPQGVVPVLCCVPVQGQDVGHDWVTFSFCQSTFGEKYSFIDPQHNIEALTDAIETHLDQWLFEMFGFGLGKKRDKGMHWYQCAYELQDNLGMVLYGHKSRRIAVQINGSGCSLARLGWNERLYDFLHDQARKAKLNRVDLAFDDFEGEFITTELADEWDDAGLFFSGGRPPEVNHLGNWKRITGKGRTLTIGDRTSYKFARIYERGKKEGDNMSPWVRAEIEFKATQAHIPLDILLNPTDYFSGAYPAFRLLIEKLGDYALPTKLEIVKKQSKINELKAISIMKHQFGKYMRHFAKYIEPSELIRLLSSDKDEVPKRLQFSMAAVHQAICTNQPIQKSFADEFPLFVGADYNFEKPIYEEFINAI
ncbi:phage replication initiation protein [Acinetobacter marinus]|uniref:Phage replication initiation protein n=1 Tax=Acinetobacter marinus TaxID=281375 RepID=A0A1G6HB23_9GAMM|nr:replication initiation factor domain-containing protein [Acinetobacter marinus]SDB91489.1 phage replication initiation protein [Acinetobacter marinus]